MKTLAFTGCLGLSLALVAGAAQAQGYAPDVPRAGYPNPGETLDPYGTVAPSPGPLDGMQQPPEAGDTYDEDGYDADVDVYYDTVASQNYDDGYDPNAYQQFQSALDPYGQWENDPEYGEIWEPSASVVGGDFSPYATGGHWALTEYGWTWVSDWDWGWGPFHYGRWIDRAGYGWCWVPGSIWGPGWVSWRYGGGYAGWSPLPPRGVTVGPPRGVRSPWRFVLAHQLGDRHANFLPSHIVPAVFSKTSVVTNLRSANSSRYNAGPNPTMLNAPVRPIPLQTAPHALPHPTVVARPGVPVQSRPYYRNVTPVRSIPIRPYSNPRAVTLGPRTPQPLPRPIGPVGPARPYNGSLTVVHPTPVQSVHIPAPTYQQPAYSAPAYHYNAPAPTYHYSAPAPSYHYSAPAPSYHYSAPAPSYHYSAPAPAAHYSAPAPSFHSAPSHFSGGGGGHHR